MDILPTAAERFLHRFEQALSLLGAADTEALVGRLRSRLQMSVTEGRLHSTLLGLGTPEGYAQRLAAPASPAAGPGRALVPIANDARPSSRAAIFGKIPATIRTLIDELSVTFRASRDEIWGVGLVLFVGLTVTDFVLSTQHATSSHAALGSLATLGARFILVVLSMTALYRSLLTEDQRIWDINAATLRYIGANLLLLMAFAATAKLALAIALQVSGQIRPSFVEQVGLICVIGLLASAAYLRTQPWLVALSIDDRSVPLIKALASGKGFSRTLFAWAICVAPLFLLHILISTIADQLPASALFRYGLGFSAIDGGIATLLCLLIAHINVIAYRRVAVHPRPDARPYSSKEPNAAYTAYTRDIFLNRLAENERRRLTCLPSVEAK